MYMDRHEVGPGESFTAEDVVKAHELDLQHQAEYGVRYLSALVDVEGQRIFCVAEGPSKEACETVHREAHGMMATRIVEVEPDIVEAFFGQMHVVTANDLQFGGSLKTILVTDMEGSTGLYQRLGDEGAAAVRREHDQIIRDAIEATGGREIKHTGDGLIACFTSVVRAADCAVRIQVAIAQRAVVADWPIRVRVGLTAGEPLSEAGDLFGATMNQAARICAEAEPGTILAARTVRELALGKDIKWEDVGPRGLRGFDEPVHLFKLVTAMHGAP